MYALLRRVWNRLRSMQNLNPARIVVFSFGGIILVGTLLLMLPVSARAGVPTGGFTALFTATSATCVTGLVLVDTWAHWSLFGQAVILVMIQLGGLGFMTVITLASFLLRRRIGLSQRLIIVSTLNLSDMDGVVRVVRHALMGTCLLEGVGAVILAACFFPEYGLAGGLWRGIFHSVSSFCNAGFDLMGSEGSFSSLVNYRGNPVVLITVMLLVVAGGLGFFVWEDLLENRWKLKKLSTYSKMVLLLTAFLLAGGALFFLMVEWGNAATLGEMPVWEKGLNAVFQSVTLRTAGFNTLPQEGLRDSSLAMSCILMLVGGSSGSTAGGLKTATVGVLFLALRSGLAGRDEVTLRRRTIPHRQVTNAITLTLIVIIVFQAGAMILSLADGIPFLSAAFEVASAMGTVGVTTGITPSLSRFSQGMLTCMMFLGRVGIMSFSIAFLSRGRRAAKIKYPAMDMMIG